MARDPLDAPVVDVQDAVLRQDMEWLLAVEDRAEQSREQAEEQDRRHAEDPNQHQHDDHRVAGSPSGIPSGLRRGHQ